jgi:rhamnosyltransferase|tara:strand:+ start:1078 stop:1722 length:645 start_codon:yes stop_codon:yes gene_type:complete
MDNISIVLRNRNEGEFIGFAIQSCLDHFKKPEIIVVDNGSTDDSLQTVNLFKDRAPVKVISINDYSPGKSINLGVAEASNDLILVLSAHAQITEMNLDKVIEDLKHNVAVFGNQIPIYKGKKITKRYIWSHFKKNVTQDMFSEIENRHFLHNAFCFYNKNFLLRHPFDEKLSGKEDRYWARDMIKKGYHFLYNGKELMCNHYWTTNGATWKGMG